MNIVLLGPPGAGKGTLAALLKTELNVPHISTGDIFRSNIKNGTELGKKVQGILASDHQGSIDVPAIRDHVAFILEGGREAFIQRKEKYEF